MTKSKRGHQRLTRKKFALPPRPVMLIFSTKSIKFYQHHCTAEVICHARISQQPQRPSSSSPTHAPNPGPTEPHGQETRDHSIYKHQPFKATAPNGAPQPINTNTPRNCDRIFQLLNLKHWTLNSVLTSPIIVKRETSEWVVDLGPG